MGGCKHSSCMMIQLLAIGYSTCTSHNRLFIVNRFVHFLFQTTRAAAARKDLIHNTCPFSNTGTRISIPNHRDPPVSRGPRALISSTFTCSIHTKNSQRSNHHYHKAPWAKEECNNTKRTLPPWPWPCNAHAKNRLILIQSLPQDTKWNSAIKLRGVSTGVVARRVLKKQ